MKSKFYALLFLFCLSFIGYTQTGIGVYPSVDGGFENQTTGNLTTPTLSISLWVSNTTGGRNGSKHVTFGLTSSGTTTAKYYRGNNLKIQSEISQNNVDQFDTTSSGIQKLKTVTAQFAIQGVF